MLNTITSAINTKLLVAILAALGTIAALLVHQQIEAEKTAKAAAQAAAILKQQQEAEQKRQKAYEEFTAKVNAEKRRNSKMPANQGKTWRTYLP
jgi:type II secretory pathway pseudopilin PulG